MTWLSESESLSSIGDMLEGSSLYLLIIVVFLYRDSLKRDSPLSCLVNLGLWESDLLELMESIALARVAMSI